MATAPDKESNKVEQMHTRLRECIEEARRLTEKAQKLIRKYHEMRDRRSDQIGTHSR